MGEPAALRLGAVVLAGGRSRRMGEPKALADRGGVPLAAFVAGVVAAVCDPVVICHAAGQRLPDLPAGVEPVADSVPDRGPLQAIADGIRAVGERADAVFVAATDLPLLTSATVASLAELLRAGDRAVVPLRAGRTQPLAAVYRVSMLVECEQLLAAGDLRATALAATAGVRLVDAAALPNPRALTNVNTPAALRAALGGPRT
ncbi:MAG TPA: molybdenum cofactor guanylyltransferase [Gaiellales bacterium]|nr:molybdenum cofactor guanylyltransferase [Gaiellales bacterium]